MDNEVNYEERAVRDADNLDDIVHVLGYSNRQEFRLWSSRFTIEPRSSNILLSTLSTEL